MAASLAVDSALGIVYFPLAASLTPQGHTSETQSDDPARPLELSDYASCLGPSSAARGCLGGDFRWFSHVFFMFATLKGLKTCAEAS